MSERLPVHFCASYAFIATVVILIAARFGKTFVHDKDPDWDFVNALSEWDGQHFKHIVERGYDYTPGHGSLVALFPGYPVVAKGLAWVTGLSAAAALVIVANVCCLAALVLMGAYLGARDQGSGVGGQDSEGDALAASLATRGAGSGTVGRPATTAEWQSYALLAMGLLPTTFFWRMAYSEAMFLCAAIGAMYAIARGWRIPIVALIVGFATATRPVGVALLAPLVWYVWQKCSEDSLAASFTTRVEQPPEQEGQSPFSHRAPKKGTVPWRFALTLAYAIPLGCWGLIAYMIYQWIVFGQPLAFALTQADWRFRPAAPLGEKLMALASWEPIWTVYVSGKFGYWGGDSVGDALFSLQFANPIYFVGTAALIAVGAWKRWLTTYEVLLSIGLLAIPYVTRAYDTNFASQGRFAAVAFPVYIVLGHLLARLPLVVSGALLALSGFLMAAYAVLFATGHELI